jgi:hypothetical protein
MAHLVKMRISIDGRHIRNAYIDFTQIEYIEDIPYDKTIIHMKSGKAIEVYQAFNIVVKKWEEIQEKSNESKMLEEIEIIKNAIVDIARK